MIIELVAGKCKFFKRVFHLSTFQGFSVSPVLQYSCACVLKPMNKSSRTAAMFGTLKTSEYPCKPASGLCRHGNQLWIKDDVMYLNVGRKNILSHSNAYLKRTQTFSSCISVDNFVSVFHPRSPLHFFKK